MNNKHRKSISNRRKWVLGTRRKRAQGLDREETNTFIEKKTY